MKGWAEDNWVKAALHPLRLVRRPHLHIFVHGSVLEIRANENTFVNARVYQVATGPPMLKLEGNMKAAALDLWQVNPISPNRPPAPTLLLN